ncbi:MAG TPA: prepilin peptidase [Stellaceae bacterium]|jgi:prepilin peptidase CpaA|nr:prepilin peptidase [Stellaceae bacterium]
MIFYLQAFALAAFTAVMVAAAFEDFRRQIIPNLLPIILCAVWPLYLLATGPTFYGAGSAVACAAAVFCGGAILFRCGCLGGGDVKLLSAATLWVGPGGTLDLLMVTVLLGGPIALFFLIPQGRKLAGAIRRAMGQNTVQAERVLAMPMPYGIAIAGAAMIVTLPPFFG